MKGIVCSLCFLLITSVALSQTVVLNEDFESAVALNTYAANGNRTWAINSNLSVSGTRSDSAAVVFSDTLFLETPTLDFSNYIYATLNFEHICKIDLFDAGIIQYSLNNGQSWNQLTTAEYQGSGFLFQNAFSAFSYGIWDLSNAAAVPSNSWWQSESFDLSAVGGQSQVKIRFALIDGDNNGAVGNYGWLIDNIVIQGAACELIPPTISQSGTVFQGKVYNTGPYTIEAQLTDASGIGNARVLYSVNGGSIDTLVMSRMGTSSYFNASIPSASIGDTICYFIEAFDNSTCGGNMARYPRASCIEFEVANNIPTVCVGTPVFNFNYEESFASFIPGNGSSTVGTLQNNWENDNSDNHDWWVYDQSTSSGSTGPVNDHSLNDNNFLYVESSNPYFNRTAILNTPCYDLTGLPTAEFSFWYHMNGTTMGDLNVDVYSSGQWISNVTAPIVGNQGNQWLQRKIDLSSFAGDIIKLRFRANTGSSFYSDIAIDDIEITVPADNELSLKEFITPSITGCSGSAVEYVTVKVINNGSATQTVIPLAYSLNGGLFVRDTAYNSLMPGDSLNHTFQQTVNLSNAGVYSFDAWVELPNEDDLTNDSIKGYNITSSQITANFPDTTNFDNFIVGTPGTLMNEWTNSSSDQYDWFVHRGATNSQSTGPSGDNTTGLGNYIYIEATNSFNLEAKLESPCFDISNLNSPELTFFTHMLGSTMGELHLDVILNGIVINDIMPPLVGNQGSNWNIQTVDLSNYKGVIKLVFRGITGTNYESDIAIDDVSIRDANPVGLSDFNQEQVSFAIYPNPAKNYVWIESTEINSHLVIRNALGKVVEKLTIKSSREKLPIDFLAKGVYFFEQIEENGNRTVEKLIVR